MTVPVASARLAARVAQQKLQRGENVACLSERRGRLLLAHADDREAAFADTAGQTREIAVARHDAEALHRARVQDVHGVDDHGRVGGILALSVAELLDGRDGVLQQRVFPLGMERERPVAVDALVGDGAVLRQLVGDGLYIFRRHVVGIDQKCEPLFRRLLDIHVVLLIPIAGGPDALPLGRRLFFGRRARQPFSTSWMILYYLKASDRQAFAKWLIHFAHIPLALPVENPYTTTLRLGGCSSVG